MDILTRALHRIIGNGDPLSPVSKDSEQNLLESYNNYRGKTFRMESKDGNILFQTIKDLGSSIQVKYLKTGKIGIISKKDLNKKIENHIVTVTASE